PPSAGITKICFGRLTPGSGFAVPRSDRKAIRRPSGDHRGRESRCSPAVNCRRAPPSTGTTHRCERYVSASRSTTVWTNTRREPAGSQHLLLRLRNRILEPDQRRDLLSGVQPQVRRARVAVPRLPDTANVDDVTPVGLQPERLAGQQRLTDDGLPRLREHSGDVRVANKAERKRCRIETRPGGGDIKDILFDGVAHAAVHAQGRVECGPQRQPLQVAPYRVSQLPPGPYHGFVREGIELCGDGISRFQRRHIVIAEYG